MSTTRLVELIEQHKVLWTELRKEQEASRESYKKEIYDIYRYTPKLAEYLLGMANVH
jgi:hypothetical protein